MQSEDPLGGEGGKQRVCVCAERESRVEQTSPTDTRTVTRTHTLTHTHPYSQRHRATSKALFGMLRVIFNYRQNFKAAGRAAA